MLSQQEPTMHCNVVSCRVMHLLVVTAAKTRTNSSWPSMMSCHLLGPRNLASHRKEPEGWHHERAGARCPGEHWGSSEGSVPACEDEQTCFVLCELGVYYPWHVCLNELWGVIKCETCKNMVSQTVFVWCEQMAPSVLIKLSLNQESFLHLHQNPMPSFKWKNMHSEGHVIFKWE